MLRFARLITVTAAALGLAAGASALVIDDFTTAQTLPVTAANPGFSSQVSGPGILGGERDGDLAMSAGGTSITAVVNGGTLSHNEAAGSDGILYFTWDGADGSAFINYVGLGGLDLTEGGTQNALEIQILLNASAANLSFQAYTSVNDQSVVSFSVPAGASTQIVPFSDFSVLAGTGADFSNLGALLFFSPTAVAGQSMNLGTIQTTSVPEPSSAALLALGLVGIALARGRR